MKLLFCKNCNSVFSLSLNFEKSCDCGQTKGKYIDQLNAEFSGENGVMLGFNNNHFRFALTGLSTNKNFTAFVIKEPCLTFKRTNPNENHNDSKQKDNGV